MKIYCLKCREKTATNDLTTVQAKNGRYQAQGNCAVCGQRKYVFVKGPPAQPVTA